MDKVEKDFKHRSIIAIRFKKRIAIAVSVKDLNPGVISKVG